MTTFAPGTAWGRTLLDGIAIDPAGRMYVAANDPRGQIWRVDPDGSTRQLANRLRFPSAVAVGYGPHGFREGNIYVVTFCGEVLELADAAR